MLIFRTVCFDFHFKLRLKKHYLKQGILNTVDDIFVVDHNQQFLTLTLTDSEIGKISFLQ